MLEQRNYEVAHYPYKQNEDITKVRRAIGLQFRLLLGKLPIPETEKKQVNYTFISHFINLEAPFLKERKNRWLGNPEANLFYHNLNHTYQAGFDSLAIANTLIRRNDHLAENLSAEGLIALSIAGLYHDIGYITANPNSENFASHTPIHVEAGIKHVTEMMKIIPFTGILDNQKIAELLKQGIHNTHFPFNPEKERERRIMIAELPKDWRKEAMIVRLATQLADLGGQTIRIDQSNLGLHNLRAEMNAASEGFGTKIIGTDEQLLENEKKFTTHMVLPTVGKTANAFFGKNNIYQRTWKVVLNR